jgi:hypothetical protein
VIFKPKLLLTEDDFRAEGFSMKNCMSKQFINGIFSIFISLQKGRKKINLQYRKGMLVQSYGKANTPIPVEFADALKQLNEKMEIHQNIVWEKIKYDIID